MLKCEQTVDCWLKEVDGWLKEVDRKGKKKQVQKVSRKENEKCESLFVCVCTTRTE